MKMLDKVIKDPNAMVPKGYWMRFFEFDRIFNEHAHKSDAAFYLINTAYSYGFARGCSYESKRRRKK